MVDMTLTEL